MERADRQKEGIHDIGRQELCWPKVADSISRVHDRNESALAKSRAVCDGKEGEKKNSRHFVRDRLKRLT